MNKDRRFAGRVQINPDHGSARTKRGAVPGFADRPQHVAAQGRIGNIAGERSHILAHVIDPAGRGNGGGDDRMRDNELEEELRPVRGARRGGDLREFPIAALPDRLERFYGLARAETLTTFAWLLALWAAFMVLERFLKRVAPLNLLMRLGGWTTIAAMLFALFATRWFDWLSPLYAFVPEKGPLAMGFFPLTFASAYYVPHILLWSSWRYAIVRDSKTRDSSLMIIGGVLNFDKREFNLQRLVDTHIHQEWWQRLCNVGSIELIETGGGKPEIIWHVDNPNRLDLEIKRAIKENRRHSGGRVSNGPDAAAGDAAIAVGAAG